MKSSSLLGRAAVTTATAAGATLASLTLAVAAIAPGFRPPARFVLVALALGGGVVAVAQRETARDRWQVWRGWRSSNAPYWLGHELALHHGRQAYAQLVYAPPQSGFAPTTKPGPVIDHGTTQAAAIAPSATGGEPIDWLDEFLHYPSVLIHGAPGSGKSTAAEALLYERMDAGHDVEVVDVHRKFGQWSGLVVVGDGMDYAATDCAFKEFLVEVRSRYARRATDEHYDPIPKTILVEEFTSMAGYCPSAADFFATSVSDIRKINLHVIYVSHARTMTGLGGSKGLAATRDASLLELELFAQTDKTTKKAAPTGRGRIRYPGGQTADISLPEPQKHRFHRFPEAEAEAEAEAIENRFPGDEDRDLYRRFVAGDYRSQKAAIADLFGVFGGRRYADAASRLKAVKTQGDREGW
jgi:hypothetical protein